MPKIDTNHRPSRRALLLGAPLALTAGPALSGTNPDAELIRLCAEYVRVLAVYDRDGGRVESDHDPLWHAVEAAKRKLDGLEAHTMEGVVAKARVALYTAQQPDGSENFSTSFTGHWPEEVIRDLLRLHGEV